MSLDDADTARPWKRLWWIIAIALLVLAWTANTMMGSARRKAAEDRVRKAEEAMTYGPGGAPKEQAKKADGAAPPPPAEKKFSAEEAEREMAAREKAIREQFDNDQSKQEKLNRQNLDRANLKYEREQAKEAQELRRRQIQRVP